MNDPDQQYDEKMQGHLDDAHENIETHYPGANQNPEGPPVYVTTDKGMFTTEEEAVKHQYKIEREKI